MSQGFVPSGKNINDEDGSLPQPTDSNSQLQHSNKRSNTNSEANKNPPNPTPLLPNPSTFPIHRSGKINIFYKTRLCLKFIDGVCRNGDSCTFAHGANDLREPPPNWQEHVKDSRGNNWNDDQKIIQRMRICKNFYNGGECPYGDKCTFLHESPAKFRPGAALDSRRLRDSSVISIPTVAGCDQTEGGHPNLASNVRSVQVKTASNDPDVSMKAIYRKSRMCSRWETTGQCVFGDKCHFAHGLSELHTSGLNMEGDARAHGIPIAVSSVATAGSLPIPMTEASASTSAPAARGELRGFAKLANKKIKGIYGDWIDEEDNE